MGDDGGVKINVPLLLARLTALQKHFSAHAELYGGATALQLLHGKREEGEDPLTATLQIHLFGYEFPETLCVLANGVLYMHGTAKKLSYLEAARAASAGGPVKIELVTREKGDQSVPANAAAFERLVAAVAATAADGSAAKLSIFPTDKVTGAIPPAWLGLLKEKGIDTVDATKGVEAYFAVKDAAAVEDLKQAGNLAARCMKYVLVADMEKAIDKGRDVSNEQLGATAAALLRDEDKSRLRDRKVPVDDAADIELALPPAVMSGGEYNVFLLGSAATDNKPAVSGKNKLSYDVIMMGLGMRFGTQRAVVGRTYMIDPTPNMQKHYDALLEAENVLINNLVPGKTIAQAVNAAKDRIMAFDGLNPAARIAANFGCGMGPRLQDKYLALSGKNNTVIEPGMSFCICMGLRDVPMDDKHPIASAHVNNLQQYCLMVADTVLVEAAGAVVLTDRAPRDKKNVVYEMAGEDEEEEEEDEDGDAAMAATSAKKRPSRSAVVVDESKGRDATGRSARLKEKAETIDPDAVRKREEHQAQLVLAKKAAAEKKAGGGAEDEEEGDESDISKAPDIDAYPGGAADFPKNVRTTQITVDKSKDSVLLPILGQLVPFHISTIKNVVKSEEGQKAFLRVNFYGPGATGKDVPPSMAKAIANNPSLAYIKSLNFMSREHRNFVNVEQLIKAMLKKSREARKEEVQKAGLVAQEKLVITRDDKVPRMTDVNMWPAASGRKAQGTLEAHANGLRFRSNKAGDPPIDIIYANVKVPIYQPCEGEHIVLLHFHLKHPILIGKKKYKDVQFYTDVVETSESLDKRGGIDDPDELAEEQRSEQLKAKMNSAFRKFAARVEEIAAKDAGGMKQFEVPPRDMAFQAAPFKEMTTAIAGLSAIIAVVDKPPVVVPVEDVELVHFERVVPGTKSFDMVCVFKAGVTDKGSDEFVRFTSIELKHLEPLKTWLDEIAEVTYTESAESLDWKRLIPEEVRAPEFWLSENEEGEKKYPGMLGVLHPMGGEEEEEDEEEESESYSEDEDEDEDDDDDDFSELVDSEDEDESDYDEDEDEDGEDWDELERQAEEDDKKRKRYDDDEDDDRKKKAKKGRK